MSAAGHSTAVVGKPSFVAGQGARPTLCIVRLQIVHCRAVGLLSPLLLVVVVVEVPLLWSTTLQGEVLEVLEV